MYDNIQKSLENLDNDRMGWKFYRFFKLGKRTDRFIFKKFLAIRLILLTLSNLDHKKLNYLSFYFPQIGLARNWTEKEKRISGPISKWVKFERVKSKYSWKYFCYREILKA